MPRLAIAGSHRNVKGMRSPNEDGATEAASELDSLCKLFPEYCRDEVKKAYQAAKRALADFEGHPGLMRMMQQKLQ